MTPAKRKCVRKRTQWKCENILFIIPMNSQEYLVVTKENVAEAIYLLEYKFLCSLSRDPRWLLIIFFSVYQENIRFKEWRFLLLTSTGNDILGIVEGDLLFSSVITMLFWVSSSLAAIWLERILSLGVSALSESVSKFKFTTLLHKSNLLVNLLLQLISMLEFFFPSIIFLNY